MSFGEQFATPMEFVRAAWDKVLANAYLPGDLSARAFSAWAAAHRSGQPREEFRALFELLAGTGWTWPEYDRWETEFERGGQLPYMWDKAGWDTRPDPHGERPRCAVLAHTLAITAYALNRREGLDYGAGRRGGYRLSVIGDCPVEAEIAARYAAQIEAGDLSVVPPFFPGDRTLLMPKKEPIPEEAQGRGELPRPEPRLAAPPPTGLRVPRDHPAPQATSNSPGLAWYLALAAVAALVGYFLMTG